MTDAVVKPPSQSWSTGLPYPHLIVISRATVRPLVRDVGEKVRDMVQKKLGMSGIELVWYHHRWLLPGKPYSQEQFESWRDPLLGERRDQDWILDAEPFLNIGMERGGVYHGRTLPLLSEAVVFVAAASLPPFSDEGPMRAFTPYRAGVTVVHEMRHLWQAAQGWEIGDERKCERDAEAFARTWRNKVKEIVQRGAGDPWRRPGPQQTPGTKPSRASWTGMRPGRSIRRRMAAGGSRDRDDSPPKPAARHVGAAMVEEKGGRPR